MSTSVASPTIGINVLTDLASTSALKTMLSSQQGAVFQILGELEEYAGQPISAAAAAKASASVNLTAPASWETSNGICFSLTPAAKCSISVDTVSETFPIAMNIESTDPKDTQNVSAKPQPGDVCVNIDLDFGIQGSASGSGSFNGIGVAGKASGSKDATLSFCQPVPGSLNTLDAITKAFSQLYFPLEPKCVDSMPTGSIAKVSFDGALNCELDVSYGLGNYKVSAPSLSTVQQSLQNVVQLTAPSVEIDTGVKGAITYTHADHFALIVNKTDDTTAALYLVRSSENDWGGSVGIAAGVTTTAASVTLDANKLQSVVQNVTGNSTLAAQVVSAASQPANSLETSLNAKLKSWASDATGEIGLTAGLSLQKGHTALFVFDADLTKADLVKQSWAALVGGNVKQALDIKGFTLEPGSGVMDSLNRGSTIQFQFFDFFSFKEVSEYFSHGYTELGKDGTIRFFCDLGQEQVAKTKQALQQFRIYFEATASESQTGAISQDEVDMYIELSEQGKSKYAAALANVIGFLPASATVNSAQEAMVQFASSTPVGTLDLILDLKSSAYQKLSCSPYNGKTPPPLPQQQDQDNWEAFQEATEKLDPDVGFVDELTYGAWETFNRDCVDEVGSMMTPDRRQVGNILAPPPSFYQPYGPPGLVAYFLQASASFMNLCDDLKTLAAGVPNAHTSSQWENILDFLTKIATDDLFIDYAKPTAGALLSLCSEGGVQVSTSLAQPNDKTCLTCTVTIA